MRWIQVPPQALRGEGLAPYKQGEIRNLFDWAENPEGASAHLMPHRGQFIVDVVRIEANAVHQPSKPGDEVVVVLKGALHLTDDADKREQTFRAGEMVLIPGGWAGIYRVVPDGGAFLELAIVPGDYFEPATPPPPSGLSPRRIEWVATPGDHAFHQGRYALVATNRDADAGWRIDAASEEIIHVLTGTLRLTADGATETFGPGSVLILPRGFRGDARATAPYRALTARWIG